MLCIGRSFMFSDDELPHAAMWTLQCKFFYIQKKQPTPLAAACFYTALGSTSWSIPAASTKGNYLPMMWGIPLSPKPRLAGDAAPCRSSQPRTTRKEKGFGHLLPALPTGKNSPFFFCCTTPEFSAFKRVLFLSFNLSLKPITNCNLEKVSC